jgi:dolichol-phosphate mannosyltransferase
MTNENLVICPVYNEQDTIKEFYHNLRNFYIHDVVFIDDGSNDRCKDFLLYVKSKKTFLIGHPERRGYGAALLSGFRFSLERGYKKIITIDVDLQHNPENIPLFLSELEEQEVVLGSRYIGTDIYLNVPGARLTINRYVSKLIGQLFSVHFTDPFCGFRGYRETFLKKANLSHTSYGLGLEIILEIIRTKTPFKEIPIKAVYNNHLRKFLDGLEDPRTRLLYYLDILSDKKMEMLEDIRR